jgi:hypothetical protein
MSQKATFGSLAKYGFILGLALIIFSLTGIYLKDFTDQNTSLIFMLLKAGAYVFFIYCAIRFSAKYLYAANYSFAKGIKTGLFVGLIAAVLATVYQYMEIRFIDPADFNNVVERTTDEMIEKGFTEGMYERFIPLLFYFYIFGVFLQTLLISLLASLFIAPFFKKQQLINLESTDN